MWLEWQHLILCLEQQNVLGMAFIIQYLLQEAVVDSDGEPDDIHAELGAVLLAAAAGFEKLFIAPNQVKTLNVYGHNLWTLFYKGSANVSYCMAYTYGCYK